LAFCRSALAATSSGLSIFGRIASASALIVSIVLGCALAGFGMSTMSLIDFLTIIE
jgi:hypothetical protein